MFVDRRIKTRRKQLDRQRRRTKTGLPGLARKTISENTDIHTMKAKTNRRHSSVTTRTILSSTKPPALASTGNATCRRALKLHRVLS